MSAPDLEAIAAALTSSRFRLGISRGQWDLICHDERIVVINVAAAVRPRSPSFYTLRFDLTNYPREAPTAHLWDRTTRSGLGERQWPVGSGRVAAVFNFRYLNGTCLYLPCDRTAIQQHARNRNPQWAAQYPDLAWNPKRDLTFYLEIVSGLLSSSEYTGAHSPISPA